MCMDRLRHIVSSNSEVVGLSISPPKHQTSPNSPREGKRKSNLQRTSSNRGQIQSNPCLHENKKSSLKIPMERTRTTLRKSIHIFLKNYHLFTIIPSLIAFPFSIFILLFQSLLSFNSLQSSIQNNFLSLSHVAGFPPSFSLIILKLSQAITSLVLLLPFTLSSLLFSKSVTICFLKNHQKTPSTSIFNTYAHMLTTQLWNFFLIIAANSTCFALVYISFSFLDGLGFSSHNSRLVLSLFGAVLYSIILANTLIISNLALISSGAEQNGGYLTIINSCFLIRGRTTTALALAILVNFTLAAIESLFQYRVTRIYYESRKFDYSMVMEGIFIAYLYSIIVVVDTIISYVFFKSCKLAYWPDHERMCNFRIEYE